MKIGEKLCAAQNKILGQIEGINLKKRKEIRIKN